MAGFDGVFGEEGCCACYCAYAGAYADAECSACASSEAFEHSGAFGQFPFKFFAVATDDDLDVPSHIPKLLSVWVRGAQSGVWVLLSHA